MCGIAGVVSATRESNITEALVHHMCHQIVYRGPDDEGIYVADGAGLGMRRLSHHRSLRRPSARFQRRPQRLDRFQRRDLQLSRTPPRARKPRPSLPHPQRHRSHHSSLRRNGRRLRQETARHVRPRHLRQDQTQIGPGPRPPGQKAAALRAAQGKPLLRVRN